MAISSASGGSRRKLSDAPAALGASLFCNKHIMNLEEHERFVHELLANPNRAEAHSWLEECSDESFRNVGELESNEKSLDLIQEIYRAGALEVIAVEIDKYPDGGENTGKLVIVMPKEPNKRRKVLGWCSKISEDHGFAAHEDFGQQHEFVMLD